MNTQTVLLIILAAIVALGLTLFQYYYRAKNRGRLGIILAFLRFLTWFASFLLLINPKFSRDEYGLEKSNLIFLVDNSSSISPFRTDVENLLEGLHSSPELESKFELSSYGFGSELEVVDSLAFVGKNTNISNALRTLKEVHSKNNSAVILLSDGNQTFGNDYIRALNDSKMSVYPIVIGDTTQYEDLRVVQVNANKYAFLKNKYPLEVFVAYEGSGKVTQTVTVSADGKRVHSERLTFSGQDNSKVVNVNMNAESIGVKYIQVAVSNLDNERNTNNNKKNITVEVIDEKTNVAIVTDMMHPDIGALKKAIESNEQRSVSIKKPNDKNLDEVDLFILYQPNASFGAIYNYVEQKNLNSFEIIGPHSDLGFLNRNQAQYSIESGYPVQEVIPEKNEGFAKFDLSETFFDGFPPLESDVGPVEFQVENETILQMIIKGVSMNTPLLSTATIEDRKSVVLFGENIWKWRSQTYRNEQSFKNFDDFIGKLMVYLSDNKSKERLSLDFKSIYEGSNEAYIRASYFDEAFNFNPNVNLTLQLRNTDNGTTANIPMLLKNGFYEADLTDRTAGDYAFSVSVDETSQTKSGSFRIMDFDVEKQFLSTNDEKLQQLADNSAGTLYYSDQTGRLIETLTDDERYTPVQTSVKKVVSLIDFRILLGIIAITLALEWFIRKYNGLT